MFGKIGIAPAIPALVAGVLFSGPTALAEEIYIGGYMALLGPEDRVNSRGVALQNAAAIVRQDRANYHKFGIRHAKDQPDPWFDAPAARQAMQPLLVITPGTAEIITRQDAFVAVSVFARNGKITAIKVEIPG